MWRSGKNSETRVLLFVTLKRRDLFPMQRIAKELCKRDGYAIRLSGISDFPYAILDFRPHIVLFGKPDNAWGDWLRCMSGCTVISLNTEQGGHDREEVICQFIEGHAGTRGPALELVDHHLIVDERTKGYLSQHIDPARMHVVGYPRLLTETLACEPTAVGDNMVVGFACGEDVVDKRYLVETFRLYQGRQFGPWRNVQTLLTNDLLELVWINNLVSRLREDFKIIVRYRHGDDAFLLDEDGVELDSSASLEYLLSAVDLLIVGRSTVGIEALIAGIPAITVSGLIRPANEFVGAKNFWTTRLLWQPETSDELLEMVEARSRNDLDLSPDLTSYQIAASEAYFCGQATDRSIERIVDVVMHCERGDGATLDLERLCDLFLPSRREHLLLKIARFWSAGLAYRLALSYLKIRRRVAPDNYLRHTVFIPD